MNPISKEKCRIIMLEILTCIDKFCKDNNLRYTLGGGTLLGAVRHGGFIPWDDDIDISMPRPDYDYFVSHFNGYSPNHEVLDVFNTVAGFSKTFAKVQDIRTQVVEENTDSKEDYGLFVDVFPIDGISENLTMFKTQLFIYNQLESILRIGNTDSRKLISFSSKTKKMLYHVIGRRRISSMIKKLLTFHNFTDSKYTAVICGSYGIKERVPKRVYDNLAFITFEGQTFSAISNYDSYLGNLYGEYMQLPPEDKRINHSITAYWRK